jgi:aryl-alcohol dehydrogenase-like predicted oxidoreductase
MLPACDALGAGSCPTSPIARGALAGKHADRTPPPAASRAGVRDERILETDFRPEALAAAGAIAGHAPSRGIEPVAFALAWVLANPIVTGAIAGPRTMAQWRSYLGALEVALTEEDERAVDRLAPAGTTAVRQLVDPRYPVEGRPRR